MATEFFDKFVQMERKSLGKDEGFEIQVKLGGSEQMKSKFNVIYSILLLSIMVLLSIFYQGDMLDNNPETKQFQHNNERKMRQG